MRFTIERTGPDVDALIDKAVRDMTTASRQSAREIAKVGVKAFKSGAGVSHFAGYPLKFKAKKITATATRAEIEFQASPVGFWCMLESGAKPHKITARRKRALSWGTSDDTVARSVDHPGMAGRGSYSKGEAAAIEAMDKVVEDTYGEALGAR